MAAKDTIRAFVELGKFLQQFRTDSPQKKEAVLGNDVHFDAFEALIQLSQSHNGWFTTDQVQFAIGSWADALTQANLDQWLAPYQIPVHTPKTIGLVLAGNIPLVGFHDLLSVLIAGHKAVIKTSSNDQKLLPFLANYLQDVEPSLAKRIQFTEGKLENYEAVIATGSNNTARYFEYYFKDKPSLIRKNRNSVAVLSGQETQTELHALGEDIFRYFGLGCRNVSKLFVPEGYDFTAFFEAIFAYQDVIHYEKYANNYDYNKAVFLMSNFKLLDNGFLTLKEDTSYASPISSVFYEYYNSIEQLKNRLNTEKDQLQCIVSSIDIPGAISFGTTQKPALWDYADQIDTLNFVLAI
ncbi:MAG: acyl-CoA reductase [Flavobacterium sp.]|nr:acyl-CoA reductase [Flavobacterium sp.]